MGSQGSGVNERASIDEGSSIDKGGSVDKGGGVDKGRTDNERRCSLVEHSGGNTGLDGDSPEHGSGGHLIVVAGRFGVPPQPADGGGMGSQVLGRGRSHLGSLGDRQRTDSGGENGGGVRGSGHGDRDV